MWTDSGKNGIFPVVTRLTVDPCMTTAGSFGLTCAFEASIFFPISGQGTYGQVDSLPLRLFLS